MNLTGCNHGDSCGIPPLLGHGGPLKVVGVLRNSAQWFLLVLCVWGSGPGSHPETTFVTVFVDITASMVMVMRGRFFFKREKKSSESGLRVDHETMEHLLFVLHLLCLFYIYCICCVRSEVDRVRLPLKSLVCPHRTSPLLTQVPPQPRSSSSSCSSFCLLPSLLLPPGQPISAEWACPRRSL